ncbi:hypothetical protein K7A41_23450 [Sphingobacterium sp. InxBP1]|uniref:hypothetical protein n=1 Tax=Sphingobacterium sp. InxBP1 TaxID=2870328 RepID=UPI0022436FFE|nr:hypothetical protein [Sphingobacterium sp. InxBP1]MCW8314202.1 hypothetical protein [Sphingobacterium sp. InxBP1]
MEIFEPKNFFDFAELLTNVFTGAVAVVGLLIALKTYEVATRALGEWKNEKKFDIDIDGYAYTIETLKLLEDLRKDQYNPDLVKSHSKEILTDIYDTGEFEVYNSYIKLYSYMKYYQDLKPELFSARKIALTIFNQSDDQELIDFYNKFMSFESTIFSAHHNYHTSVINRFIDKYEYKKINKENIAPNLIFNALKQEKPESEDFDLHVFIYDKLFLQKYGDWLQDLRVKQTSFFYKNFKRNTSNK